MAGLVHGATGCQRCSSSVSNIARMLSTCGALAIRAKTLAATSSKTRCCCSRSSWTNWALPRPRWWVMASVRRSAFAMPANFLTVRHASRLSAPRCTTWAVLNMSSSHPPLPPAPAHSPAVPAAPTALPRPDVPNPLLKLLVGKPLELLTRYADRDAPDFDKLKAEVEKTDETVISKNAASFNGVNLAVELHRMASPTLLLHGKLDPLVTAPSDDLIKRIYAGKPAGNLLAFVEDDLRHFPMLEITAKFNRLLMDFLDAQDLNNVQFKDQWRRTMR